MVVGRPKDTVDRASGAWSGISIPMFVFQGKKDFTTSIALARHFGESVKAPDKAFVPITGLRIHSVEILAESLFHSMCACGARIARPHPFGADQGGAPGDRRCSVLNWFLAGWR